MLLLTALAEAAGQGQGEACAPPLNAGWEPPPASGQQAAQQLTSRAPRSAAAEPWRLGSAATPNGTCSPSPCPCSVCGRARPAARCRASATSSPSPSAAGSHTWRTTTTPCWVGGAWGGACSEDRMGREVAPRPRRPQPVMGRCRLAGKTVPRCLPSLADVLVLCWHSRRLPRGMQASATTPGSWAPRLGL